MYSILRLLSKSKNGLKICHINAQSLVNKIDEFRHIFEKSGIHVICVSETWFRPDMSSNLFNVEGYKILRADRVGHAGGVAIYIKSDLQFKIINRSPNDNEIEYLFLELSSDDSKLLLGSVYRPNRNVDISTFIEYLEELSLMYNNIVLAGDFNSDLFRESYLSSEMSTLGLYSCNCSVPTHFLKKCNTLLDLFFVNDLSKCRLYDQLSCPVFFKRVTYNFRLDSIPDKETYY